MTVLIIIGSAIVFFALIMASIALHEVGHLLPAKLFGVKTTQYFVGFGKTLWSRKIGETEYGIKAIPLGGYVKLIGMFAPGKPTAKAGPLRRLADDARWAESASITPADEGRLFYQKKTWQKLLVMLGGPAMNILLAFLILWGVNAFHGQYRPQPVVAAVSECVVPASRAVQTCQTGDPASPAKQAGFKVGDQIISFNGVRGLSWPQLSEKIRDNADRPAVIEVIRDGKTVTLTTTTMITGVPNRMDPSKAVSAGFLGITPSYTLQTGGPVTTATDMWSMTKQSTYALVRFPAKIYHVAADLITGKPRDVNGPISVVGASRVAGEITVDTKLPVGDRVASWFMMLGAVNLFVALLNLVPLMPLDGGHIAGALYEWVKRNLARLVRRPDPGHADTALMLPVAYLVGGFLVLSGIILVIADVFSPVKIF